MQAREWVQFVRFSLPSALAVKVSPTRSFPVWVRPAGSDGVRVEFEVAFADGDDLQKWDVDMVESVVADAVVDGAITTVPVEESQFSELLSGRSNSS